MLGENLRLLRKLSRLTQEQLAEGADLAPAYISRVEQGLENISVDSLARIARVLDVELAEFFRKR